MEFKRPSPEQAYWGLRAMKTVALADGAIEASELHMMESIQRILGTDYQVDQLEAITPAELACGVEDRQIRNQLVHGMIVMSLIDGDVNQAEVALIEQFAQALGVTVPEVTNLRHFLQKEILQLRLDLVRRVWVRDKIKELWNEAGI